MEKRQIFCQRIYIDTPPLQEVELNFHPSPKWTILSNFLPKNRVWWGRGRE